MLHAVSIALKFGLGGALILAGLSLVFCFYACKTLFAAIDWLIERNG